MIETVEQLIHSIATSTSAAEMDLFLFNSLSRQLLVKKLPLTHKQHELAKSKLTLYKEYFREIGIENFDLSIETLGFPIRVANKDKTIKIVTNKINNNTRCYVEVKFPFNKKEIKLVGSLRGSLQDTKDHYYKKDNSHFFLYSDNTFYQIVNEFSNRNFVMEENLTEHYNKIKFIKENPHQYVPGVYGSTVKNLHKITEQALLSELGELNESSAIKYLDRKQRFGLTNIEFSYVLVKQLEKVSPCALQIASRANSDYLSKPDEEKLEDLLSSLEELDRFPLLVILSTQISPTVVFDQLKAVHGFFKNKLENTAQSVLFRLDHGVDFNSYIKENNLNNWVDSSTKIVYINYDKLPKVILKSNWSPLASLSFSTLNKSVISTYIDSVCDLNIVREKDFSIIKQYTKNK